MNWFKHDVDAQRDLKIRKLLRDYGYEGYGLYWHVVELLYNAGGKMSSVEVADELEFAGHEEFLQVLIGFSLVNIDENADITCDRIQGEIEKQEGKKKALSEAGKRGNEVRWGANRQSSLDDNDAIATQSLGDGDVSDAIADKEKEEEKKDSSSLRSEEKKETDCSVSVQRSKRINYDRVTEMYNAICISIPKVKSLTDTRREKIKSLLRSHTEEELYKAFEQVEASDFLTGRSGKWGNCGFDWIINPSNFQKIIEGNFENARAKSTSRTKMVTDEAERAKGVNADGSLQLREG